MIVPLPTSHEAEQAVVAAVLRTPDLVHHVPFLRPDDFADDTLRAVYRTVRDLVGSSKPCDWRSVAASFEGRVDQIGKYLRELVGLAPHELELPGIAQSVRDLADRRRLIILAEEAADRAREGGQPATELAATLVGEIGREIGDAGEGTATLGALAERVVDDLPKDLPCHTTGLERLDQVLGGGLYAGKLYGLLARMKAGKTTLLSTIAYNAASAGCRVLYLPLEMGATQLTERLLARRMGVNSLAFLDTRRRRDRAFGEAAAQAALSLRAMPLAFQARPRMAYDDLRQTIAREVMRTGVQGVILDYLQLVTGAEKGQSQALFLDQVTQGLAEVATRLGCWVIAAAQENQTGNVRGGEGLLNACDATMQLHPVDRGGGPPAAWIELKVARYVLKRDVGSEADPALELDVRAGPHFREIEPPLSPEAAA